MSLLRRLAPLVCVFAVVVMIPAEQTRHRLLGEDNIICRIYLDPHDKFTRVEAEPRRSISRTGAVEVDAVLSNITVNYTGFTGATGTQAQAAFQAAVDIWKTQVESSVPIVVDAEFKDLGSTGLLGSAGSSAVRNFTGATRASTWFPFPLANKLAGTDLGLQFEGTGVANIGASFNSTANWYYGTDGLPPAGMVDFESVVLHELGTVSAS